MLIDDYFKIIETWITDFPFIHHYEIEKDKRSLYIGFLNGVIQFIDGSELHFMEFVDTRENRKRYKYSYHYQDSADHLKFRYDMVPHHPNIKTTPHHKHIFVDRDEKIIESEAPILPLILQEIGSVLKGRI